MLLVLLIAALYPNKQVNFKFLPAILQVLVLARYRLLGNGQNRRIIIDAFIGAVTCKD